MNNDKPTDRPKSIIFRGEVAYDINSLPANYTIEEIGEIYTKTGILLHDSKGTAPYSLKVNKSE